MRTCGYCDGEYVMPPPREDYLQEDLEKPYVCMGCHRRLTEKETINRPDEVPTYRI